MRYCAARLCGTCASLGSQSRSHLYHTSSQHEPTAILHVKLFFVCSLKVAVDSWVGCQSSALRCLLHVVVSKTERGCPQQSVLWSSRKQGAVRVVVSESRRFPKRRNLQGSISPALQTKPWGHLNVSDIVLHICVGHVLSSGLNPEAIFCLHGHSMSQPPFSISKYVLRIH